MPGDHTIALIRKIRSCADAIREHQRHIDLRLRTIDAETKHLERIINKGKITLQPNQQPDDSI
ncbi:hypothetical protein [Chamaesiphon sp.]|uniref:hypothetical protein n=1 Tax=Chamaesiphon sp. TaxID=2814140 RepID=UPI0035933CA7